MIEKFAIGIIISTLLICLVFIFCAIIIKLYLKKIKEHNLKEVEFQKTLNQTIMETQEQVLQNLSQDLHDDIGQQLTFVNFQIEKIKLDNAQDAEDLDKLSASVFRISESIRGLSHSMNNQLLKQNKLLKAMQNELERIKKYKDIEVRLEAAGDEEHFPEAKKIIVFRIFQEALNNCLKHAQATKIKVEICFEPHFRMAIKDNGRGFDAPQNQASLGLLNLSKRAQLIEYQLNVHSAPGQGTEITIA